MTDPQTPATEAGQCPTCGQKFGPKGLAIHNGIKHVPPPCRYRGDNRGWCVTHDAGWRIDRAYCEGHPATAILDPQP